ncbi:secretoglobin family 1D member 2-like [Callithrix jacchus]|uniref:secretoglobin family 1D member 2-like n=1 Tax=Callithrix jacchus TaxID=9483 RepID=UPI001236D0DB|nr:secretoglobin family 1D member 2-like [Callithrix jacchus]
MRLSVCLLLVMLALCCYRANAEICPALLSEISGFFFISEPVFKLKLAKYDAPPEAVAAILEMKKCPDQMALEKRLLLEEVQLKIVAKKQCVTCKNSHPGFHHLSMIP